MWALLTEDTHALIISSFVRGASSADLARAAMVDRMWLLSMRQERQQRTTQWRGGLFAHAVKDELLYVYDPNADDSSDDEDGVDGASPRALAEHVLARACKKGDIALVEQQLAGGVQPDFLYESEQPDFILETTPLFLAVQGGHAECVRLLLDARATILNGGWEPDDHTSLFCAAIWLGHIDVVRVLTEFGVPRYGRSFIAMNEDGIECDAESVAHVARGVCSKERQQQIYEFLVETRKFNARAGDPAVYTRLQVEEHLDILVNGSQEEQQHAIYVLEFLAMERERDEDLGGFAAVRELALPAIGKTPFQVRSSALAKERLAELRALLEADVRWVDGTSGTMKLACGFEVDPEFCR